MTRDEELWSIALHLERKHGERAPVFVAERIGALALAGDMAGIETWKRVAARLDVLRVGGAIN